MRHKPTKPQTMKLGNVTFKVGTVSGKPMFSVAGKSARNVASGVIDNNTPDDLIQVAIAMREILGAGK